MSLDRALAEREPRRAFRVTHPDRDVAHDFRLPRGQPLGRRPVVPDQGCLHRGRHPHQALGGGPDGGDERFDGEALLHDRARSQAQRGQADFDPFVRGKDDYGGLAREFGDLVHGPLVHLQIEQQNVAGVGRQRVIQAIHPFDFGYDFEALQGEQRTQSLPEERMVIGDYQTHSAQWTRSLVQSLGISICRQAGPLSLKRSRPPVSATWEAMVHGGPAAGGKPTPSSAIVISTRPAPSEASIRTEVALACLRALRSPSSIIWSIRSPSRLLPLNTPFISIFGSAEMSATTLVEVESTPANERTYSRTSSNCRFTPSCSSVNSRPASSGRPRRSSSRQVSS